MNNMCGKKVMLIALQGYSDGIVKKIKDLGAEVDYFNDKPNDGFVCKACGRFKVKPYELVINNYYGKFIDSVKHKKYDYILVIRGEYTPIKSLKLFRKTFKDTPIILYMWDSIRNNKGIDSKWAYYDEVYTFDRKDYLNNRDKIKFLPLFYYEDFLPKLDSCEKLYDVSFIGTGHEDRVKIIKEVKAKCEAQGLTFYSYIYLPHVFVYYYNKLFNKNYKNVKKSDINFKKLAFKDTYKIYASSKCVMDIESSTQSGLTMRTIEMIGLKKKLVTTNADVVNYDFYNENNVMLVDRNKFNIDKEFFDKDYEILDDKIYQSYSLSGWLQQLLK